MSPPLPVSSRAVLGGLIGTLFVGLLLTPMATLLGMALFFETQSKTFGMLVTVGAPTALYIFFWLLLRGRYPDFAKGMLLAIFLLMLWAGLCGAGFVGQRIAG